MDGDGWRTARVCTCAVWMRCALLQLRNKGNTRME